MPGTAWFGADGVSERATLDHERESGMSFLAKAGRVVAREIVEVLPVMIFFLIGLNLIAFTKHVVLAQEGIVYNGISAATIGALLVAKVVMVADKLPIMRIYRGRPFYRAILYRAGVYTMFVLAAQLIEMLVRSAIQAGGITAGLEVASAEFVWPHFVFIPIWVFVLFLVYVTLIELKDALNQPTLARLLFGRDDG